MNLSDQPAGGAQIVKKLFLDTIKSLRFPAPVSAGVAVGAGEWGGCGE